MSNKGYLAIIGILVIVVGGLGYKFYSFKKNAEQEIQNLMTGLDGGFVLPGPSGAPGRRSRCPRARTWTGS